MLDLGLLLYVSADQLAGVVAVAPPAADPFPPARLDLKNHGVDPEPIFAIGEDTFDLPEEELMKFEQGDGGMSAGFKKAGSTNVDKEGNTDTGRVIDVTR